MKPSAAGDPARELLDRIRAALPAEHIREVRMFGAVAVMLNDAMAVAVHKDGSLLVRVDPAEDPGLLEDPHASRAEMGAGRAMGAGWIRVEATALSSEATLTQWLDCTFRYLSQRARNTHE